MVALNAQLDRFAHEIENWTEEGGMERFTHPRRCAYPVRAHASRIRGIVRSRATSAGRHKAHALAGIQRRRRSGSRWELFR